MKRKRHSEEPINCDPEGARGRHEDGRSVPQAQDQRGDLRQLKAKCGRVRSLGSQTDEGLESENARLKKLVADARRRRWRTVRNKRDGGESGIRTHGTVLPYTRFPSVRLKPLGHLSGAHRLAGQRGFFQVEDTVALPSGLPAWVAGWR